MYLQNKAEIWAALICQFDLTLLKGLSTPGSHVLGSTRLHNRVQGQESCRDSKTSNPSSQSLKNVTWICGHHSEDL